MNGPILLVGITARMGAELATRAGYAVIALDYFGDSDLSCPGMSLRRDFNKRYSPASLVDAAAKINAAYVAYTASLENHPHQVRRLSQGRQLLGNGPAVLTAIRQPERLAAALRAGGFAFPETISRPTDAITVLTPDVWLWKPRRSGGGHGIKRWQGETLPKDGVLQRYLPGLVGSAIFAADGHNAVLLGVTEQLVGEAFLAATGFRYCGNILPPRLESTALAALTTQVTAITSHLTRHFGLRGLNGLDFVWHQHQVWPLEVNPRLSASMELIDKAYGLTSFDYHVRAFQGELPPVAIAPESAAAAKGILFASRTVQLGDTSRWLDRGIHDVPHPGETIKAHHPICTLVTTADTPAASFAALQAEAERLKAEIYGGVT